MAATTINDQTLGMLAASIDTIATIVSWVVPASLEFSAPSLASNVARISSESYNSLHFRRYAICPPPR